MVRILQGFNWPIADLETGRLGKPGSDSTVSALASKYPAAYG